MKRREFTKKNNVFWKQSGLSHFKILLYPWVVNVGFIVIFGVCSFLNPGAAFSVGKEFQLGIRDKIFGSYQVDDTTCWAVGDWGLILKTADGGKTWEKRGRTTTLALYDIFFVNSKGWIVGDKGLICNNKSKRILTWTRLSI